MYSKYFASRWWWYWWYCFPFRRLPFFVNRTRSTMFHTLWLCRQGICCLYQTYGWCHRKCSFMFPLFGSQPSRFQKMTNAAHVQHIMKNTVTIFHRNFQLVMQFGSQISYCHVSQPRTCSTFASIVDVDGRPLRRSSSMVSRPSRERLCQSSTWNCFNALSPYGCCNMIDIQLVISAAKHKILSYAYWTVHHLDIWMKIDQLWWHLFYYVNLLLNMFRMLIHPSPRACDYLVRYCVGCIVLTWGVLVLCSGIGCLWCGIRV